MLKFCPNFPGPEWRVCQVGDWAECHISLLHKLPARYRFITPPDTAGPATTGIPASFAIVAQASILGRTQNRKIKTKFWKIFFMLCWGSPSLWTTNYFHNRFTTVTRRHAISNIFYVYDVDVCIKPSLCTEMDVSSVVVVSEFIRYAMANMNFGNF